MIIWYLKHYEIALHQNFGDTPTAINRRPSMTVRPLSNFGGNPFIRINKSLLHELIMLPAPYHSFSISVIIYYYKFFCQTQLLFCTSKPTAASFLLAFYVIISQKKMIKDTLGNAFTFVQTNIVIIKIINKKFNMTLIIFIVIII